MEQNILIKATALYRRFKGCEAVRGVSLEVRRGEALCLIGPNGAGKSTTIAMLLGLLRPDAGHVDYWRKDFRAHVGVQLQTTPFFEGYTAMDNLSLFAALYRINPSERRKMEILEAFGLVEARDTPALRLSPGQQKRLALAVTTLHNPELVLLDEPAAGLDPRTRHDIRQRIRARVDAGGTVLFTSHDMEEVSRTADRMILLYEGRIAAQGEPAELPRRHCVADLEALYLKLTEIPEEKEGTR